MPCFCLWRENMRFIKEVLPYIVILLVVILIRTYIITPVIVNGESMSPTLKNNELLLLKKYDKKIERFDIVVFKYNDSRLIKRVIGLPGDKVEYKDGKLYINDEEMVDPFSNITKDFKYIGVVSENSYFVLGDNRNDSVDSRMIGSVTKDMLLGSTDFSIWPIKTLK